MPTAAPAPSRLPALDVLRGLAILGTLLTNIWIFASPRGMTLDDLGSTAVQTPDAVARVLEQGMEFVTDGKWIGLLTIMFGIGLEIQRQSALRRGESWPGTYPWRAGLLIVEGLLNYLFIFEFDVLMGYGLTGLVVAAVLATSPRVQKIWLWIGLSVHLLFMAGLSLLRYLATVLTRNLDLAGPDEEGVWSDEAVFVRMDELLAAHPEPTDAQLGAVAEEFGVEVSALREMAEVMGTAWSDGLVSTDSWWAMVVDRTENFWAGRTEIPIMLTMGVGLFLVGAFLYRRGLFLPAGAALRRRLMVVGLGIGIPLDVASRTVWVEVVGGMSRYVTSRSSPSGCLRWWPRSTPGAPGPAWWAPP